MLRAPFPRYSAGQWSPLNPTGRKQYDRTFLLAFREVCKSEAGSMAKGEVALIPRTGASGNVKALPFNVGGEGSGGGSGGRVPNRRSSSGVRRADSKSKGEARVIRLPKAETKALDKAENAWVRPTKAAEDDAKAKEDEILRSALKVLNVIVPQTFDKLSMKLIEYGRAVPARLADFIDMIFTKALDEPTYSPVYARLCLEIDRSYKEGDEDVRSFRSKLLSRCQKAFEQVRSESADSKAKAANPPPPPAAPPADETADAKAKRLKAEADAKEEEAYKTMLAKKRKIGNIKFIGELFKVEMINYSIIHQCIDELLSDRDESCLECLCKLVETTGRKIYERGDKSKEKEAKETEHFKQMKILAEDKSLPSRIRFMLQDIVDLRARGWVERRKEKGPMTLDEIHHEVKTERSRAETESARARPSAVPARNSRGPPTARPSGGKQQQQASDWQQAPVKRTGDANRALGKNLAKGSDADVTLGPKRGAWSGGAAGAADKSAPPARSSQGRGKGPEREVVRKTPANAFAGLTVEEADRAGVDTPDTADAQPDVPAEETAEAAELTSEQKADCLKRCKATIVEFLNIKDTNEVQECLKDYVSQWGSEANRILCQTIIAESLPRKEEEGKLLISLLTTLIDRKLFDKAMFSQAVCDVQELELSDIMEDAPKAPERLSHVLAVGILRDLLPVTVLSQDTSLDQRTVLRMVLFTFVFISKLAGEPAMLERYSELPKALVDYARDPADVAEMLKKPELELARPLATAQKRATEHMVAEAIKTQGPAKLKEWVGALPEAEHATPALLRALTRAIVRYVYEMERPNAESEPDTSTLWKQLSPVLAAEADGSEILQLHVICSVHALANDLQFPSDFVVGTFFYFLEKADVVGAAAFHKWRELADVQGDIPPPLNEYEGAKMALLKSRQDFFENYLDNEDED